ncbi:MAG: hypothetical protein K0B05_06925 [Bacteroidales bacterium]|nr:hypothetical protein [Bacteroidales bacterium]
MLLTHCGTVKTGGGTWATWSDERLKSENEQISSRLARLEEIIEEGSVK